MRKPIAFNCAEAIFEQFWDPEVNPMDQWDVRCGDNVDVVKTRQWDCFRIDYRRTGPGGGRLFGLERGGLDWDVTGYDRLLSFVTVPKGVVVSIEAETDKGSLLLGDVTKRGSGTPSGRSR